MSTTALVRCLLDRPGLAAVDVVKHRTHLRLDVDPGDGGSVPVTGEVTRVVVRSTSEILHSAAIEGTDLDALALVRSRWWPGGPEQPTGPENLAVPEALRRLHQRRGPR